VGVGNRYDSMGLMECTVMEVGLYVGKWEERGAATG